MKALVMRAVALVRPPLTFEKITSRFNRTVQQLKTHAAAHHAFSVRKVDVAHALMEQAQAHRGERDRSLAAAGKIEALFV